MSADKEKRLQEVLSHVSRETVDNLSDFEELFRKWSKAINLASPSTLDNLWERHIVDSAQLFDMAPSTTKWLDLGSGGGFPGVVLAILLKQRPGGRIDLVESNGKKAAFLRTALGQFSAPGTVHAARNRRCLGQNTKSAGYYGAGAGILERSFPACGALAHHRRGRLISKRTGLPPGN